MKNLIFAVLCTIIIGFSSNASDDNDTEKTGPITLSDPHFVTQIYDWEIDGMWEESLFSINIDCPNATHYEVEITHQYPTPFFSLDEFLNFNHSGGNHEMICYLDITPIEDTNRFEFEADWGEVYKFQGWSESGGWSNYSEPIFSTDYITDPAILERINELKNIYTGIEDVLPEVDPAADLIHRFGDTLKVRPDVSDVTIYNDKGEKVLHVTDPGDEVSIQEIGSGVYFAVAKTADGLSKILKFIK